jgi:hypothetical protein
MKKLYFLNEEEKERILKLHENATSRQYLSENDLGSVGAGAAAGAAIGAYVGGVGAIPGALIGGAIGYLRGSGGSYKGVEAIFNACKKSSEVGKSTMAGGTLDGIAKGVYDAVRVWNGTDEDAIKSNLSKIATIPDLCAVIKRYEENYPGYTLLGDLDGDIDTDSEWNEYVYQPLLAAKRKTEELSKKVESSGGKAAAPASDTNWGGTTNDPNRYFNALMEKLKGIGLDVKLDGKGNMWWNNWVIFKNYSSNGGYPITFANKYYFKFSDYNGKYAGQAIDKINVISKGGTTPVQLLPMVKLTVDSKVAALAGIAAGAAASPSASGAATGASTKTTGTTNTAAKPSGPSPVTTSNIKQIQKIIGVAETGVFDDATKSGVKAKLGIK